MKDGVGGYKIERIAGIDIKSDQQCEIFIHTNKNENDVLFNNLYKSFTFNDCVFWKRYSLN